VPRGGRRQGTPGAAYSNRTDLQAAPDMSKNTAATGGRTPPPAPVQAPGPSGPLVGADEVPNLSDPTMRPNENIMAGVNIGPGPGMEALGPMPPDPADPVRMVLQSLMLVAPNPDLARVMERLDLEGR
jgi:hypothetical protein